MHKACKQIHEAAVLGTYCEHSIVADLSLLGDIQCICRVEKRNVAPDTHLGQRACAVQRSGKRTVPVLRKNSDDEASIERVAQEQGLDYQGAYDYFAQAVPLKRILELDEVANWVVALCGELGDASTGSNFAITCGQVQL